MEGCPCEVCLTKVICRSEKYAMLKRKCSLFNKYLPRSCKIDIRDDRKLAKVYFALEPTSWYLKKHTPSNKLFVVDLPKKHDPTQTISVSRKELLELCDPVD